MEAEVRRWLTAHSIALDGVTSELGSELAPLLGSISAKVVLIGEARHDCQEHAQLRHRLVRTLVAAYGFDAVALESSLPRSRPTSEWVRAGTGSLEAATAGLSWGFDGVAEVVALIGFLRDHNDSGGSVDFVGLDVVDTSKTLVLAVEEMAALAGDAKLRVLARQVVEGKDLYDPETVTSPGWSELRRRLEGVADAVRGHEDEKRPGWPGRLADTVIETLRGLEFPAGADQVEWSWTIRDALMAANLEWLSHGHARVVGLAHDAHVQAEPFPLGGRDRPLATLGQCLRQRRGRDLVTIGLSYSHGGEDLPGAPEPGTLDAALEALGHPAVAVDFRKLPSSGPVRQWADARPTMRYNDGHSPVTPGDAFDIVIHVTDVSRVRTA